MRISSLALVAVLVSSPCAWAAQRVKGEVRLDYTLCSYDRRARQLPASGVTVEAIAKGWFGIRYVKARGLSDQSGVARLSYRANRGQWIRLKVIAAGPYANVQPNNVFATIFGQAHARYHELTSSERRATRYSRTINYSEETMNGALQMADTAHRAQTWARSALSGVVGVSRVGINYPAGSGSLTVWHRLIRMGKSKWNSDPDTLLHELGHTFWLRAIPFWNWRGGTHYIDQEIGPTLALSEGFASFISVCASDVLDPQRGYEPNQQFIYFGVERHHYSGTSREAEFRNMSDGNELNVAAALYDLSDRNVDSFGVAPGTDRVQGGGPGVVFRQIKAAGRTWGLSLKKIWQRTLRPAYGANGAEVMRMNGIAVD